LRPKSCSAQKKGEGEKRQREKKKNEKRRGQIPAAEATNRTEQAEPEGVERERLSALLPDLEKNLTPGKPDLPVREGCVRFSILYLARTCLKQRHGPGQKTG